MSILLPESQHDVPLYALMAAGGACAGWLAGKSTTATIVGGVIGLVGVFAWEKHLEAQQALAATRQAALLAGRTGGKSL